MIHPSLNEFNCIGRFIGSCIFFNKSFQSSKGTYDENAGVITLYDNTYIVLEDGTSLNTDKLTWYGNGKETVADGHVVIKKNHDMIATAQKGVIDPGYEKFRIIGKTNTKIFSDKEK